MIMVLKPPDYETIYCNGPAGENYDDNPGIYQAIVVQKKEERCKQK